MTTPSHPSGTVTFLFTDIEGSTRRWESEPEGMRTALAAHDDVLRAAVEAHGGWLFKHTGDGVCAAFATARPAVDAAVAAQRQLALPVRMGVATGEAEQRDGDYFGPALNRAARVMAAGHGGQILLAASTASLVSGLDLVDLGEHRLRDLSGVEHLFQVRADGLASTFAPLRTLDATPGNLPAQLTSFVGRDVEVKELTELVRAHRLVTLTGVGGVGKTRLAIQVAAELVTEFPEGVWLVELAPIGDPAAVPDAIATVLGITRRADRSVADSIAEALSGRRVLLVLDNCEHLLDAAAEAVETILTTTTTVKVIATSREGLRVGAEQLWPVPSLGVSGGPDSAAVELFVERARSVSPGFQLSETAEADAVTDICRRLDGIALAIELAAARMVSMSPQDVRDRLGDRFRLLSGARRGLERHQTLRNAVQWSYDLLDDDERTLLDRCSVFADGFDLAAAVHVCGDDDGDELTTLDLLDSLVRKSLVAAERTGGRTRYRLLETIRQFAEDRLAATGRIDDVRDRHARYFAEGAVAHWDIWDGPRQRVALDWVDVELANLRAGFRWAADQGDLSTAAAIAAHTTMLNWALQRFESVGWVEEILEAAVAADLRQLPRLFVAASFCQFTGGVEAGLGYAQRAVTLEADPRYDPFEIGWGRIMEAGAYMFAGRLDRWSEIFGELAAQTGFAHVFGLCGVLGATQLAGRAEETVAAAEVLAAASDRGNPFLIGFAFQVSARALTETDVTRALAALREGLTYTREHRLPMWEALLARDAARLEALHGDPEQALALFDTALEYFHRAGDLAQLPSVFAYLAGFFDRFGAPEVAAIVYGASTHGRFNSAPSVATRLRRALGEAMFDQAVAAGAAMATGEAVRYARQQIRRAHRQEDELS